MVQQTARVCKHCNHRFERGRVPSGLKRVAAFAVPLVGFIAGVLAIWTFFFRGDGETESAPPTPATEIRLLRDNFQKFSVTGTAFGTCELPGPAAGDIPVSRVDPGAQAAQCVVGSGVYDPCFPQTQRKLACPLHPWSKEAFVVKVSEDIGLTPYIGKGEVTKFGPWGIELENGLRCAFVQGVGVAQVGGLRILYS